MFEKVQPKYSKGQNSNFDEIRPFRFVHKIDKVGNTVDVAKLTMFKSALKSKSDQSPGRYRGE